MELKRTNVDFDKIVIDPEVVVNPRGEDLSDVKDLAKNILNEGLLTPLMVAKTPGGFTLVSGFRRLAALKMIEESEPKVFAEKFSKTAVTVISDFTVTDLQVINMIENLQRDDLKPYQVSQGVAKLGELGLKQAEIAARIGKTQPYVSMMAKVNKNLCDNAWAAFTNGELDVTDAIELARKPKEEQEEIYGKYETAMGDDIDVDETQVEGDRKPRKAKALVSKREKKREARAEITGSRAKFAVSAKKAAEVLAAIRDKGIPEKEEEYVEGVIDVMATLLGEQDWAFNVAVPEKPKGKRGRPKKAVEVVEEDVTDIIE
jgi:ParB/RepB/Spo0J family partition protein